MSKRVVLGTMLTLLLVSMFSLAFNIQPVRASGTIYIRADGGIDPSTAPIQRNGDVYTLTGNITSDYGGIVIERDNIMVDGAGYALLGTYAYESRGTDITGRSNVTIKNTNIRNYDYGVFLGNSSDNTIVGNNITANNRVGTYLYGSSYNIISGNNITINGNIGIYLHASSNHNTISINNITANKYYGIYLYDSSNNGISGNNITNNGDGIWLYYSSSYNTICGNDITANNGYGIYLYLDYSSSYNSISDNNITNNGHGIYLYYSSSYNSIFHNNFINNAQQVISNSVNVWDDGYPSGGNSWSDYNGTDVSKGPYQNETGSDGIGDTPYVIDENNQDRYPLMQPYVPLIGDLNTDGIVDILDAVQAASAFGFYPGHPRWNGQADLNHDNEVDIFDIIILANNFGK